MMNRQTPKMAIKAESPSCQVTNSMTSDRRAKRAPRREIFRLNDASDVLFQHLIRAEKAIFIDIL